MDKDLVLKYSAEIRARGYGKDAARISMADVVELAFKKYDGVTIPKDSKGGNSFENMSFDQFLTLQGKDKEIAIGYVKSLLNKNAVGEYSNMAYAIGTAGYDGEFLKKKFDKIHEYDTNSKDVVNAVRVKADKFFIEFEKVGTTVDATDVGFAAKALQERLQKVEIKKHSEMLWKAINLENEVAAPTTVLLSNQSAYYQADGNFQPNLSGAYQIVMGEPLLIPDGKGHFKIASPERLKEFEDKLLTDATLRITFQNLVLDKQTPWGVTGSDDAASITQPDVFAKEAATLRGYLEQKKTAEAAQFLADNLAFNEEMKRIQAKAYGDAGDTMDGVAFAKRPSMESLQTKVLDYRNDLKAQLDNGNTYKDVDGKTVSGVMPAKKGFSYEMINNTDFAYTAPKPAVVNPPAGTPPVVPPVAVDPAEEKRKQEELAKANKLQEQKLATEKAQKIAASVDQTFNALASKGLLHSVEKTKEVVITNKSKETNDKVGVMSVFDEIKALAAKGSITPENTAMANIWAKQSKDWLPEQHDLFILALKTGKMNLASQIAHETASEFRQTEQEIGQQLQLTALGSDLRIDAGGTQIDQETFTKNYLASLRRNPSNILGG